MDFQDFSLGFNKGFDRSVTPYKADPDSAYELLNLRISRAERGRLEQTPYFYDNTYSAANYWNGSTSTTEVGTVIVGGWYNRRTAENVLFSSRTMKVDSTQVPIFYQSMTMPETDDLTKGCLLVINNVSSLGITLGQTVDIEIDGTATFKWRKNGGAYTTAVPITTTGVSIDGGNATIYFLTASGFTATDSWSWRRTDSTTSPQNTGGFSPQFFSTCEYGTKLIWLSCDNRVMIYDPTVGYCRSIGYQPICGYGIKLFEKHLFVADSTRATGPTLFSGVLRCSDLNDVDNFIPTDVNEADLFTFIDQMEGEAGFSVAGPQQLFISGNRICVLTGQKVQSSPYIGLPDVFSFDEIATFGFAPTNAPTPNRARVVQTTGGAYIMQQDGIWFTDGVNFTHVGAPQGLTHTFSETYMAVDFTNKELVVLDVSNTVIWVYSELYKTWCRRSASFSNTSTSVFFLHSPPVLVVGASSLHYYIEDESYNQTPAKASTGGTIFALPRVVSQLIGYGNFAQVKDISGSHLLARASTVTDLGAGYLQTSNIIIKLYWGGSTDGTVVVTSTHASAVWTVATADSELSFPRFSARAPAFRLDVMTTDATKPPAGVSIILFQPRITSPSRTPTR